ncbi:hypothetical protein FDP41_005996 [Naegleria fowleri]|uniref:Uncharacterized protein n=1 Tax=Naegleria fowleri TaxID=5763 RepID=A0A6A5BMF6_NAEFO|nr:uncharacterized protein FDP41_005996 [Naegleria fowleri]KAF0975244.1 hypothetical protein FDP41_005996 [Naegleria fowleri]
MDLLERFNVIIVVKISGVEKTELEQLRRELLISKHVSSSEWFVGKHSLTHERLKRHLSNQKKKFHITRNDSSHSSTSSSQIQNDYESLLISALTKLKELLVGQIALLFTNSCEDYSKLKKEMTRHVSIKPARVGSIVKEDVYFQGPTRLDPMWMSMFLQNNIHPKIRMGQIEFPKKRQILKANEDSHKPIE